MPLLRVPLRHWQSWQHLALAIAAVVILGLCSWWELARVQRNLSTQRANLESLQKQLSALNSDSTSAAEPDFSASLPAPSVADDVSRDIARFAQSNRVQINSLSVLQPTSGLNELPKIQFSLAANGAYADLKSYLSELLDRYRSLGVANLSIRTNTLNAEKLDASFVLVLYVQSRHE